jgi:NADH-quinone oxidoreductase subunit D
VRVQEVAFSFNQERNKSVSEELAGRQRIAEQTQPRSARAEPPLPIEDQELHRIKPRALAGETTLLNVGPQHPGIHGLSSWGLSLELRGENIVSCIPRIGYLHSGIEKSCEDKTYTKVIPLTGRMDYLSPLSNNLGYVMAVEKLMKVDVPIRAQYIRVILAELARIASHMVWLATSSLDMGATSMFLYTLREREHVLDILEMCSGRRMMSSYFQVGGLWRDVPEDFEPAVRQFLAYMPDRIREYERLLKENPIWKRRTVGIGVISAEQALVWSLGGPCLRASGVDWDLRKVAPYSCYGHFEFDVPLGTNGDAYDRYRCRMLELWESLRIVEQALDQLPQGTVMTADRKVAPPPKEELASSIEALIHHFKLWTEGFVPPQGELYHAVESPRGEFGVYINSDGSGKPRRVHFRTPTYANLQALPIMSAGLLVADLVAVIGSIDLVLGDVDR